MIFPHHYTQLSDYRLTKSKHTLMITKNIRRLFAISPPGLVMNASLFLMIGIGMFLAYRETSATASILNIDYGFGAVIQGIVEKHSTCAVSSSHEWCSYATRMPLIPILGAMSYTLGSSQLRFLLIKNIIFWTMWVYGIYRLKERFGINSKWIALAIWIMILSPYNLVIASKIDVEEGYLSAFLVLLFVSLLTASTALDYVVSGLLAAFIYLTKSSMLGVCGVAILWCIVMGWKAHRRAVVACVVLFCTAVGGWGTYIYRQSGVFAIGANASSWNGRNFYKGNNPWSAALYPRTNLDILDHASYANKLLTAAPAIDEWDLSGQQLALGRLFVKEHPDEVLRMDLSKLFVACCDLKETPEFLGGHDRKSIEVSNLMSHLLFATVLMMMLYNATRRKIQPAEILFCLSTVAYLVPYVAGFLYMRHMVPLYFLAAITFAIQLNALAQPKNTESSFHRSGMLEMSLR